MARLDPLWYVAYVVSPGESLERHAPGRTLDTFAAKTWQGALELAMPDPGSTVYIFHLRSPDAAPVKIIEVT